MISATDTQIAIRGYGMTRTLDHFDVLTDKGLKVIPLRPNSKVPMYRGWNKNWTRSQARESVMRFPDCNLGFLLGDIIDVEGDSPQANLAIERLVDGFEHPTYKSTRSVHHLFRTPDQELRIFKHNDIEFRGYGHQSVLPPSRTEEVIYRWLSIDFPVPEMPEPLLKYYLDRKRKQIKRSPSAIKKDHVRATCTKCGLCSFSHKNRFDLELEALQLLGLKWQCRLCREIDLRPVVRILRKETKNGVFEHKADSDWSDLSSLALSVIDAKNRVA